MTNKDIYNHQYALLSLPKFATWKSVKRSRKYLKGDFIYDSRNQGTIEQGKPLSIMGATYDETMFSELAYIPVEFFSSKKNKKVYDEYLRNGGEVPTELVELVDDFIKRYKSEIKGSLQEILSDGFSNLEVRYYDEMYNDEELKISYHKDISNSKLSGKIKFSTKYFLEYIIPNYWGYIVLGITFIIFLIGIIYGITK